MALQIFHVPVPVGAGHEFYLFVRGAGIFGVFIEPADHAAHGVQRFCNLFIAESEERRGFDGFLCHLSAPA